MTYVVSKIYGNIRNQVIWYPTKGNMKTPEDDTDKTKGGGGLQLCWKFLIK